MSLIPFDANDPHLHDEDYTYKMLLDESQKANLNTLLSKKVKICNKDNSLNLSIEAFRLIEAVSESCIHMFSFIKGERLKPFCVKERFKRLDSLHHATTIRGSTNCDLLMNKMPERDLDVVLKFGISPSIFGQIADGRSKKMESFCYYLCMNALQILFPEECKMSLLYDRQRETFFTDERTLNRISRVSGVFKKFFFAEGLNKCIVTFYPGPNKLDDGFLDVDITLQFSADETCVDGRVFSPIVAREKNAKQETVIDSKNLIDSPIQAMSPTNLSNVDSTNVGWLLGKDSASFAHDAIELVLPEEKGRIYLATAPYFKALFGWTIPDVKKHIVNKNLVIIDSSMFMGYRRFFYELTKGRVPYKDPSGDMETEKALRMLTSYSFQSIPMRSGGELDAYYSFVQDKARGPDFSYNMFYNAFITISILKNSPLVTQSSEEGRLFAAKLDFFSEILQRAFFEQKWQDLFPSFVCNITKICQEKSLQILQDIYTVKSYTRFEVKPAFKESLGTTLRINAYNGKDSGYTLTKVCTINEIFDKLQDIRDALREDFYEQLLQSISSNLKIKTITNTEKVYLLYFLNCISSENLSYKEIGSVKGNYFIFVSLIYKSFQVIPNKELLFCIHGFFHRFHFYLIQQEEFHLLDKMIGTSSIDAFSYLMLSSIFMQNLQDEPSCSSSIEKFYDDLESITSVLKRDFTNNIDPLLEMLDTFSSEFSIPLYLKILCPLSVFSSMKGTEITAKFFAKILSLDDFSWMNDREHFFIEVIFLNIILNQNVRLISEVMPKFRNHFESIFCRQLQQNSSLLSQLDACFYKKIINHAGAGKAVQFYKECLPYLNFDAVKELFEGLLQLDHPIVVLFLQQSDTETQAKLFLSLESSWTKYLSGQIERGQEDYLQALSGMFCVYPYSKDTPAVVFDIAAYLLKYIKDCSKQQQLQFLQQGLIFLSRWKRNAQPHLRNEYVNFILSVKKSRLMQDLSPAIQSKIVTDIYELKKSDLSFSEIMALTVINEATEKSWNEFRLTLFSEAHIDEKAFHQVFTHFRCVPLAANEMIAFSEAQGIGQELVVEYYKKQMAFERSFEKQLLLLQKLSSHDTYIHLVLDQIYRLQINLATQSTMKLLFALVKELSTLDEVYLNAFLQKMVCAEFLGSSIDNYGMMISAIFYNTKECLRAIHLDHFTALLNVWKIKGQSGRNFVFATVMGKKGLAYLSDLTVDTVFMQFFMLLLNGASQIHDTTDAFDFFASQIERIESSLTQEDSAPIIIAYFKEFKSIAVKRSLDLFGRTIQFWPKASCHDLQSLLAKNYKVLPTTVLEKYNRKVFLNEVNSSEEILAKILKDLIDRGDVVDYIPVASTIHLHISTETTKTQLYLRLLIKALHKGDSSLLDDLSLKIPVGFESKNQGLNRSLTKALLTYLPQVTADMTSITHSFCLIRKVQNIVCESLPQALNIMLKKGFSMQPLNENLLFNINLIRSIQTNEIDDSEFELQPDVIVLMRDFFDHVDPSLYNQEMEFFLSETKIKELREIQNVLFSRFLRYAMIQPSNTSDHLSAQFVLCYHFFHQRFDSLKDKIMEFYRLIELNLDRAIGIEDKPEEIKFVFLRLFAEILLFYKNSGIEEQELQRFVSKYMPQVRQWGFFTLTDPVAADVFFAVAGFSGDLDYIFRLLKAFYENMEYHKINNPDLLLSFSLKVHDIMIPKIIDKMDEIQSGHVELMNVVKTYTPLVGGYASVLTPLNQVMRIYINASIREDLTNESIRSRVMHDVDFYLHQVTKFCGSISKIKDLNDVRDIVELLCNSANLIAEESTSKLFTVFTRLYDCYRINEDFKGLIKSLKDSPLQNTELDLALLPICKIGMVEIPRLLCSIREHLKRVNMLSTTIKPIVAGFNQNVDFLVNIFDIRKDLCNESNKLDTSLINIMEMLSIEDFKWSLELRNPIIIFIEKFSENPKVWLLGISLLWSIIKVGDIHRNNSAIDDESIYKLEDSKKKLLQAFRKDPSLQEVSQLSISNFQSELLKLITFYQLYPDLAEENTLSFIDTHIAKLEVKKMGATSIVVKVIGGILEEIKLHYGVNVAKSVYVCMSRLFSQRFSIVLKNHGDIFASYQKEGK